MPRTKLSGMSVESLLKLRDDIGKELSRKATELQNQLARLSGDIVPRRGRGSALRGRKVPPKYRGPGVGEFWAGRGMKPHWLTEAMKQGKKIEEFLIQKNGRKRRAKR
jgi:DNA-binding protein H-NS